MIEVPVTIRISLLKKKARSLLRAITEARSNTIQANPEEVDQWVRDFNTAMDELNKLDPTSVKTRM